jgi:hypothetical protein
MYILSGYGKNHGSDPKYTPLSLAEAANFGRSGVSVSSFEDSEAIEMIMGSRILKSFFQLNFMLTSL